MSMVDVQMMVCFYERRESSPNALMEVSSNEWSSQEYGAMIGRLHFLSNNYDFHQEKATYKSTVEMPHNVSSKEHMSAKYVMKRPRLCTYHHHNCGHSCAIYFQIFH